MKRRFFLAGLALLPAACRKGPDLPSYGVVPDFSLTDQSGRTYGSADLKGKVWVANFIFTTCAGPCPRMTSQFHKLQEQTGNSSDLRFVSFTIDPARDTPDALAAYAKRFHADSRQWIFLTGTAQELNRLSSGPFHAGTIDGSLTHSTRFTLVDGHGRIRGYYDSSDPEKLGELTTILKNLHGDLA